MQFYKITGVPVQKAEKTEELQQAAEQEQAISNAPEAAPEETFLREKRLRCGIRGIEDEEKQDIREATEQFFASLEKEKAVFFSNQSDRGFTLGAVAESYDDCADLAVAFLTAQGMEAEQLSYTEETLEAFTKQLQYASRRNFINDDDEMLEALGLDDLARPGRFGLEVGENLIREANREELEKKAAEIMVEETLIPEMERICTASKGKRKILGHPVHYLVRTDDTDVRREAYQILLSSLYAAGRVTNRRYVFSDFHGGQHFSEKVLSELYHSCKGGTIVIRYSPSDETDENEYASEERETIENLSEQINKYRHEVLTVLCLPRECSKSKELFREYLPKISMVEISEELVSGEKAKDFLRGICSARGVSADKKLLSKTEGEEQFLAAQLKDIFEEWFDRKLKKDCYPQYRQMISGVEKLVKEKPKGSAYDELMGMIGLSNAKNVINDALNYFKAQKVFADKGLVAAQPTMHMVFTGNPGSAKTSCARLFARILKENGILSKGQLVECGRADLVGKYVGHTAPLVKSKFKAAEGGILFIDEAYSLVDDRSGLYGDEAINTIVQEMENHRDDCMVIFAGYPEEMEGFLNKNPGLRSRIAFHVPFDDYGTEELLQIADYISNSKGHSLSEDAKAKLKLIFEEERKQPDFGNGRYVRSLIEKTLMKQASRLLTMDLEKVTKKDVSSIMAEDIEMPPKLNGGEEQKIIGFHVA